MVPGNWNAFFDFGTNILVNLLVLTGLLRFVLKMPERWSSAASCPRRSDALPLDALLCVARLRLAQKTGRDDVCALPSGISVPHMFVVTFVIMLPITLKTGDPTEGLVGGLIWCLESFILMVGGFVSPAPAITPRAALLGTLAGVSVTFIAMRPALEMFMTPVIGIFCFAIILLGWFGGVNY